MWVAKQNIVAPSHLELDLDCDNCYLDNISSEKIIDEDSASSAPSVDQTLTSGVDRGEVAPDQGLEDGVPRVGHDTRVTLHLGLHLGHVPGY